MNKIDLRKLLKNIAIPLFLGILVGIIINPEIYNELIKPDFAPPSWVFPVVWTILYILMGISSYMINGALAKKIYKIQLTMNLIWPFLFFVFKWYFFALIWLFLLALLVLKMVDVFINENKIAGLLQIPYLAWTIFALILSNSIYILN